MSVPKKNAQAKTSLTPRTASRVAAVQALYQMDLAGTDINAVIDEFVRLRFLAQPETRPRPVPTLPIFLRSFVG
jgi:transcription termination factor NusB